MMTNTSAQMITFTDRVAAMMNLPRTYPARFGAVFSAPRSETGTERISASTVPRIAMWTVSTSGRQICPVYSTFGGYIRLIRSMNSRPAVGRKE